MIRKEKPLPTVEDDKKPFEVPEKWMWCRLGETASSYKRDIIDGPFDPIGVDSGNNLSAGLEKCFGQMIEIVNAHLNHFTIKDILEIEEPKDLFSFEI